MNQFINQIKCSDNDKGNSSSQIGIFAIIRFSSSSSPILSHYDVAIVLTQPSLDTFEPKIKPGGSSLKGLRSIPLCPIAMTERI